MVRLCNFKPGTTKERFCSWYLTDKLTDSCKSLKVQSNQEIHLTWMLQQSLPWVEIPTFDGYPLLLVEFILKLEVIVHDKSFLCNRQKLHYLHQHVISEPRRAIQAH